MDGENTTIYSDGYHARSLDTKPHPSRDVIAKLYNTIRHEIPDGFRICGENLYAAHSIKYHNLKDYFLVFSIWDNDNCLSWNDTVTFCNILGLHTVNEIYRGLYENFDYNSLKIDEQNCEGYVIRVADSFDYSNFNKSIAKYVRANHVQTDEHWMNKPITKNIKI